MATLSSSALLSIESQCLPVQIRQRLQVNASRSLLSSRDCLLSTSSCRSLSHRQRSSRFPEANSLGRPLSKPRGIHLPVAAQANAIDVASTAPSPRQDSWLAQVSKQAFHALHAVAAVCLLLALDDAVKRAAAAAAISFPPALLGMLALFGTLLAANAAAPPAVTATLAVFQPGLDFLARHLPLFFVPSLVVLPRAVAGLPVQEGLKILAVVVVGWAASLAVAGGSVVAFRSLGGGEAASCEAVPKQKPFSLKELGAWGLFTAAAAVPPLASALAPSAAAAAAPSAAPLVILAAPFLVGATVSGYLAGTLMPPAFRTIVHPLLVCTAAAQGGVLCLARAYHLSFHDALGLYLTGAGSPAGAGNLLMRLLGPVILSFGFSMFRQRQLLRAHGVEVVGSVLVASAFSLSASALAGGLLGLSAGVTLSLVPRCITVALALPIVAMLPGASPSLAAAAVVLTGLLGANFGTGLMDLLGFRDPIVRGTATAASAHGLGTAALASREPEAICFCAVSLALTGVLSTLLVATPPFRALLLHLAKATVCA